MPSRRAKAVPPPAASNIINHRLQPYVTSLHRLVGSLAAVSERPSRLTSTRRAIVGVIGHARRVLILVLAAAAMGCSTPRPDGIARTPARASRCATSRWGGRSARTRSSPRRPGRSDPRTRSTRPSSRKARHRPPPCPRVGRTGARCSRRPSSASRPAGKVVSEFHVFNPAGWAPGEYRVEILLDGHVVGDRAFRVDATS